MNKTWTTFSTCQTCTVRCCPVRGVSYRLRICGSIQHSDNSPVSSDHPTTTFNQFKWKKGVEDSSTEVEHWIWFGNTVEYGKRNGERYVDNWTCRDNVEICDKDKVVGDMWRFVVGDMWIHYYYYYKFCSQIEVPEHSNCRLVPYWREFLGVSGSRTWSDTPFANT